MNQSQISYEAPWIGGMKLCVNGHGHMTKMLKLETCFDVYDKIGYTVLTLNIRTPQMFGHPLFSEKTPILCTLYFRTRSLQGIFAVRKCSDTKNMSLISHRASIFHYLNILYICSVYLRFRLV